MGKKYLDYEGLVTYNTKVKNKFDGVDAKFVEVGTTTSSLQDQIDNLKAIGRYLSGWDCTTGLATTEPPVNPYTYQTGDYFIVSKVGTSGNKKPTGTLYNKNVPSTVTESETVKVNDYYRFDGTKWNLEINTQRDITFSTIGGSPRDNTMLADELSTIGSLVMSAQETATNAADIAIDKTHVTSNGVFQQNWDADTKQDVITDLVTIRSNAATGAAKVSNVQADWNATTGLAVILNKPTSLPASDVYEWAKKQNKPTYTSSEVGADEAGSAAGVQANLNTHEGNTTVHVSTTEKATWNGKQDKIDATHKLSYDFLSDTPTKLPASDVYEWAKASTKPTYTAAEVGARPSTWTPSKSDVGLGNVGNFKAVSTVVNQGLNDTEKANARTNINAEVAGSAASVQTNLNTHTNNSTIHITSTERTAWNNKVDKLSEQFVVYATDGQGRSGGIYYSDSTDAMTIAIRSETGTLQAADPIESSDVATKNYVDGLVADGVETIPQADILALVL